MRQLMMYILTYFHFLSLMRTEALREQMLHKGQQPPRKQWRRREGYPEEDDVPADMRHFGTSFSKHQSSPSSSRAAAAAKEEGTDKASKAMVLLPPNSSCPCDGVPLIKIIWGRLCRTFGRLKRLLEKHGKNRGTRRGHKREKREF